MTKTLSVAALAAAVSGALFGQAPGTSPPDPATMIQMRVAMLTVTLGLTDAQKTRATQIFTDAFKAGDNLQSNLQSNRDSLRAAVQKNDTAAIDTLSATAGTLSGQLMAINSKAEAAFYAILTADQKTKYDAGPPAGGPGGPGGPGPMGFGRPGPPPAMQ